MRALLADRPGSVALRNVPVPAAGAGELVVKVGAALTCGTDFKLVRRGHPKIPFPARLGHEFAGTVVETGAGVSFSPGERVTSAVSGPCGACADCHDGEENLCREAFDETAWGAFADFVLIPRRVVLRGLRRIPDGMPFETAALLDPLASVVRGVSRSAPRSGSAALIAGSGPIALLWTVLLRRKGLRVLAAGRRDAQLAALRRAGAETVDLRSEKLGERAAAFTGGRGPRLAVDTTGDLEIVAQLGAVTARGGTLQLFAGMPREASVALLAGRIHYDEVTVAGSFHYTPREADEALALLADGAIPVAELISYARPLSAAEEVFAPLSYGDAMKTALVP